MTSVLSLLDPSTDPRIVSFVKHVEHTLDEWKVEFRVSPGAQVFTGEDNTGLGCSGFFADRPQVVLAVAVGKPQDEWVSILAHEFSHACQWREQAHVWNDLFDDWGRGTEEASEAIDGWLEGHHNWDTSTLYDVISRARAVELDCEIRTLNLIEQFQLPIDSQEYAQKANAYVYFYNHLAQTRQWYPEGGAPYQNKEVWSCAPTSMIHTPMTPPSLAEAFERVYPVPSVAKKIKP